jgi:hypothetical protein
MNHKNPQPETPLLAARQINTTQPCKTSPCCYSQCRDEENPNDKLTNKENEVGQSLKPSETAEAGKRIPFDNPETEAYWNRPCRHGKYPYPDENVYLVGGAKFIGQQFVSLSEPSIIVSLTSQLAQEYYEDVSNDQQVKPISCISLAQARVFHQRFEQLSQSSE